MPCVDIPSIPELPTLPTGLSVVPPPLPRPPASLFCCKLPPLPPRVAAMIAKYEAGLSVTFPPLPVALQIALADLDAARVAINTWKDSLPLNCPRALEKAIGATP